MQAVSVTGRRGPGGDRLATTTRGSTSMLYSRADLGGPDPKSQLQSSLRNSMSNCLWAPRPLPHAVFLFFVGFVEKGMAAPVLSNSQQNAVKPLAVVSHTVTNNGAS